MSAVIEGASLPRLEKGCVKVRDYLSFGLGPGRRGNSASVALEFEAILVSGVLTGRVVDRDVVRLSVFTVRRDRAEQKLHLLVQVAVFVRLDRVPLGR
jgi:hypothetical protein